MFLTTPSILWTRQAMRVTRAVQGTPPAENTKKVTRVGRGTEVASWVIVNAVLQEEGLRDGRDRGLINRRFIKKVSI
jgi:hypothetical protein